MVVLFLSLCSTYSERAIIPGRAFPTRLETTSNMIYERDACHMAGGGGVRALRLVYSQVRGLAGGGGSVGATWRGKKWEEGGQMAASRRPAGSQQEVGTRPDGGAMTMLSSLICKTIGLFIM